MLTSQVRRLRHEASFTYLSLPYYLDQMARFSISDWRNQRWDLAQGDQFELLIVSRWTLLHVAEQARVKSPDGFAILAGNILYQLLTGELPFQSI